MAFKIILHCVLIGEVHLLLSSYKLLLFCYCYYYYYYYYHLQDYANRLFIHYLM